MSLPILGRTARTLLLCLALTFLATPVWAVSVTLEWDAQPQPELRGYKVFCRLSSDQNYDYQRPVWAGTDGRCEITGLASNTDYCFVVRAFDPDGNESGDSNEVFYPGSQVKAAAPAEGEEEPAPQPNTPTPQPMPQGGLETSLAPVLTNAAQPDNGAKASHSETQWQIFRDDDPKPLCVYDVVFQAPVETLQVPPLVLDETTSYFWRSRYINVDGNGGEWSPPQHFTTGAQAGDSDGDGLLDAQVASPDTDMNQDGVRDQTQMKIRPAKTEVGDGVIAVNALDDHTVRAVQAIRALDPMDAALGPAEGYDLPLGLLAFKLRLADGVHSASVTLHLSDAPGEDMGYVTYDLARGWLDADDLAQASDGGTTVVLNLTDGGSEDADGIENGILVVTGGYGRPVDYRGTDGLAGGDRGSAEVMGASVCFIGTAGR